MVFPGFTYVGPDRPEGHKPEQAKFTKVRSGRPEGFPWDDIWIEICRRVHYEGLPPTVAELTRYVQEWCENQYGKQPGDSTLKPKLGKLYRVLRRDDTDFSTVFVHFRLTTRDQLRKLPTSPIRPAVPRFSVSKLDQPQSCATVKLRGHTWLVRRSISTSATTSGCSTKPVRSSMTLAAMI